MKRILSLTFVVFTFYLSGCMESKKATSSAISFADNIVVAHRGAWKKNHLPENSIASLREAVRIGCSGTEFDVHLTADDTLIVNHNRDYAGLMIEKSTYAQLAATKLSNGETIPTVYEYLTEGIKQKTTMLVLELKPSIIGKERGRQLAEKVIAQVRQLKADRWMMYISFDLDILKRILELEPNAKVAYLNGELSPAQLAPDKIWGIDYHYNVFRKNTGWIAEAKKLGINLNVWTVNDAADMQWFIDQKFDYITTDEPELLFELIDKKGK